MIPTVVLGDFQVPRDTTELLQYDHEGSGPLGRGVTSGQSRNEGSGSAQRVGNGRKKWLNPEFKRRFDCLRPFGQRGSVSYCAIA